MFDELYFVFELSVRRTVTSSNLVRTVRRTILRFLTELLMRCKLQPKFRFADCPHTHAHTLIHNSCSFSFTDCQNYSSSANWTTWSQSRIKLALAYLIVHPHIHAILHGGGGDRPVIHVSLSKFKFLFHVTALTFRPIRRKVRPARQIVPRACRAKRFGLFTQVRRSSTSCSNKVREVKARPIEH